jgi:two-component system chemotaxis response regulator CheY
MRVLIVDDSEITLEMVKAFLGPMGHEVVGEACDGAEAVQMFTEKKPDLVLMDLVMPIKNGMEALQDIRKLDPAAKVIILTAVQQDPVTKELLQKGAAAVLAKPFVYDDLDNALKKAA